MNHLQEAMQRMAENDPSIVKIKRVPVGMPVLYHGRNGSMRQGRTSFPALVLKQHEDDGSLDMIVFFEAEDMIWEQRVLPKSETQIGHCWELINPIVSEDDVVEGGYIEQRFSEVEELIEVLKKQMYGDYDPPPRSMIEYLDDFDKRLRALEKTLRK